MSRYDEWVACSKAQTESEIRASDALWDEIERAWEYRGTGYPIFDGLLHRVYVPSIADANLSPFVRARLPESSPRVSLQLPRLFEGPDLRGARQPNA